MDMDGRHLARLRQLARLDVDAQAAYRAALRCCRADIAGELERCLKDHARHVRELNELLARHGFARVPERPDFKGTMMRAATRTGGALGTEGALVATVANEEVVSLAYEWALKSDWPPETRRLLERARSDEREHLSWVKAALKAAFQLSRGDEVEA